MSEVGDMIPMHRVVLWGSCSKPQYGSIEDRRLLFQEEREWQGLCALGRRVGENMQILLQMMEGSPDRVIVHQPSRNLGKNYSLLATSWLHGGKTPHG